MLMTSIASILTGATPSPTHLVHGWVHGQVKTTLPHYTKLKKQLALHVGNDALELNLKIGVHSICFCRFFFSQTFLYGNFHLLVV